MDLDCLILRDSKTAFTKIRQFGLLFPNIVISEIVRGDLINEVDNLEREAEMYAKRAEGKRYSLLDFLHEERNDFPIIYRLTKAV